MAYDAPQESWNQGPKREVRTVATRKMMRERAMWAPGWMPCFWNLRAARTMSSMRDQRRAMMHYFCEEISFFWSVIGVFERERLTGGAADMTTV